MIANGDTGAIADVSDTLAAVLKTGINVDQLNVVISSPETVTSTGSPTIGVFLYDVDESAHGSTPQRKEVTTETEQLSPIIVDLHYLITAFPSGSGNESQKARRGHELLGAVMWALRRNAIISGSALHGSLDGRLRIAPANVDETILDIWNTFGETSFVPSIAYTVGPIALSTTDEEPIHRVETLNLRGDDD